MIGLSPTYIYALGQEIHNLKYERSYYTAKKKALAEDKALLVMMSIEGCPNCSYMKDIVFERENILEYLNENFVVLIFDINRDKHIYPKRFKSLHGPTFFFLDPKDEHELREKKVGGWMPFKFIEVLQEVKARYDGVESNATITDKSESNITTSSFIHVE
jgi:thioredoxin-related protein